MNINDVKKISQQVEDASQKQAKDNKELYDACLNAINQIGVDVELKDTFENLMKLPDDQFALISPMILAELEKSFSNNNNQLALLQSLNAEGLTAEDILEQYEGITNALDTTLVNSMSAIKRDFFKQFLGFIYNTIAETEGIAKKVISVSIEKCHPDAKLPAYAHLTDAGMDVYALEDITIAPGETVLIPTGLKVALPRGYELQVRPKSGRCLKTKLRVANAPGTIDAGYRDEIGIIIDNIDPPIRAIHPRARVLDKCESNGMEIVQHLPIDEGDIEYGQSYTIGKGEKFAQLVLSAVPKVTWVEVSSVAEIANDGRNGGFGSSGLK